jgi:SAM-dependent methyltransferase
MTSTSELARWQERYSTPDYTFGKAPNEFLVACRPLLPKSGRALAVADGEGRNGVWLAKQGLDVVSIDFAPAALAKARKLAEENKVSVAFEEADVHAWPYPAETFDVVVEIFTQFSTPAQRALKWAGMRRTLKRGGLLIVQGYTPKQLQYGTGGPKQAEHLYTREMLLRAFGDLDAVAIVEEERELNEGAGHAGLSAIIGLTARKPQGDIPLMNNGSTLSLPEVEDRIATIRDNIRQLTEQAAAFSGAADQAAQLQELLKQRDEMLKKKG